MTSRIASLVAVAALLIAAPAHACYTGLTIIPTADTVGEGYYGVEAQLDGPLSDLTAPVRILNTQFGFSPGLEAGVDFDLSPDAPTTLLFNAKYVVSGGERGALALGICNAGRDLVASPYAVGTRDFRSMRGHLGLIAIDGDHHPFVGVDTALSDVLILLADYTEGDGNYSSVGAAWEPGGPWSLLGGVQFPNTEGDDTLYTVHLVFSAPYRSGTEVE